MIYQSERIVNRMTMAMIVFSFFSSSKIHAQESDDQTKIDEAMCVVSNVQKALADSDTVLINGATLEDASQSALKFLTEVHKDNMEIVRKVAFGSAGAGLIAFFLSLDKYILSEKAEGIDMIFREVLLASQVKTGFKLLGTVDKTKAFKAAAALDEYLKKRDNRKAFLEMMDEMEENRLSNFESYKVSVTGKLEKAGIHEYHPSFNEAYSLLLDFGRVEEADLRDKFFTKMAHKYYHTASNEIGKYGTVFFAVAAVIFAVLPSQEKMEASRSDLLDKDLPEIRSLLSKSDYKMWLENIASFAPQIRACADRFGLEFVKQNI